MRLCSHGQYAVCVWHRNSLIIKFVLKSLNDAEKREAMRDHCMVMHRLDKAHVDRYAMLVSKTAGKTEVTLREYLSGPFGRVWRDKRALATVQHWLKWEMLTKHACAANVSKIREMPIFKMGKESMARYTSEIKRALCSINGFQVRFFVAMLLDMCTYDELINADEGQFVPDAFDCGLGEKARRYSFQMRLVWYAADGGSVVKDVTDWCWPCMAPPSAMQWLTARLNLNDDACAWRSHCNCALQSYEEGVNEVLAWWAFYQNTERYRPLEERADEGAVKKQMKAYRKEMADKPDTEIPVPTALRGEPIVTRSLIKHARSSKHRDNIRMMWNSGLSKGFRKRYANLSVEFINRGTNRSVSLSRKICERTNGVLVCTRFMWKRSGWCGPGTMFIRNTLTVLKANMNAMGTGDVRRALRETQPRLTKELARILDGCKKLSNLRRLLLDSTVRTELVPRLEIAKEEWTAQIKRRIQNYKMQFKSDLLPQKYLRAYDIMSWIWSHGDARKFKLTREAMDQCRKELYPEYQVPIEQLRKCFASMGFHLNAQELEEHATEEEVFWPEADEKQK